MNDPKALLASGHRFIASVSGGKDSGAMCLRLGEMGIPYEPVFLDTGWELPETYDYLRDVLPKHIGEIRWLRAEVTLGPVREAYAQELEGMLGHYSAMVRMCLKKGMLPARKPRWCTSAVKVDVMNQWADTLDSDVVHCVGIRGEESNDRAEMEEWEWDAKRGAWVWRPLIRATFDDVIAMHHKHGLPPNPLYLLWAVRIGCGPCIFMRKEEIRALAARYPGRIAVLRRLEEIMAILYREWAEDAVEIQQEGGGRFQCSECRGDWPDPDDPHTECEGGGPGERQWVPPKGTRVGSLYRQSPSWFQAEDEWVDADGKVGWSWPIDKVVEWSQTKRGGKQVELFTAPPRDAGCMRWGMCDTGSGGKP